MKQTDFGFPKTPSSKEEICLKFLSDKMEATANMVGIAIVEITNQPVGKYYSGHWYSRIGGTALGNLRKRNLVMRLPELNAWRLTKEGRELINDLRWQRLL